MPDDDLIEDLDEELEEPEDAPVDLGDDDELPVDVLDIEADVEVDEVADVDDLEGGDEDAPTPVKAKKDDDEGDEDEDEEDDPDDVEADLDAILKDRIAAAEEEEDEEEVAVEPDDRADGTGRVAPKRPGEFVCQSCFLVKHPSQLADEKRQLCADCV